MNAINIREYLYLATSADDAVHMAQTFGVNLEIDEYCIASNMDDGVRDCWYDDVRQMVSGRSRNILHAPFRDLSPASVDPLALALTRLRFHQIYRTAVRHGINRVIAHSGYVPFVYDQDAFRYRSLKFWNSYLTDKPANFQVMIENEMEDNPHILVRLVRGIDDPRVGLCLNLGHAFLYRRFPLDAWIEAFLPYLYHVELNDNDGVHDRHWPLGDGCLPLEHALDTLTCAVPELTYSVDTLLTRPSLQWLQVHGYLNDAASPRTA